MSEDIKIPEMRKVPRPEYRDWEYNRSPSEHCAVESVPVAAREVRGGDEVIGLAANPARHRRDGWRVGRVLIRENRGGRTQIRIGFYDEWITWEGDSDTQIPVYRR